MLALCSVNGSPYDTNPSDGDTSCFDENNNNADGDRIECLQVAAGALSMKSPIVFSTSQPDVAVFSGSSLPALPVNVHTNVWAGWASGLFPPEEGGFFIVVCNDRNMDGWCVEGSEDQVRLTTSNEPLFGTDCADADKDQKNCPDPTEAEVAGFCMMPATSGAPTPWTVGQVAVRVGSWADAGTENTGMGWSFGTYDVWLRIGGAGCTPPQCDDKADNDGTGGRDYPNDPDCSSFDDPTE
ncbi:MAG: hypothetical protein QOD77_2159 [Thermoplasmata archaeon]|nr:hypothetical protein [Thermoplasmata archaeon]